MGYSMDAVDDEKTLTRGDLETEAQRSQHRKERDTYNYIIYT